MSFSWGKGELFRERIGEPMLEHLIPLRRLRDAGMHVACGTDWGPKNIFEQIALAVQPRFAGSGATNAEPGQVVDRTEALAMWTREAAHVLRWDGIGTLAVGYHADLTIVDRNPLTCPLDDLPETKILTTPHHTLKGSIGPRHRPPAPAELLNKRFLKTKRSYGGPPIRFIERQLHVDPRTLGHDR